jgi:hypothetical protein
MKSSNLRSFFRRAKFSITKKYKMKKQLFLFSAILVSLILVSCQKDISTKQNTNSEIATASSNAKATPAKPFKGEYTTTVQVLSGPPQLRQRITGIGHATHLGESSFVANNTITIAPPPPFLATGTTVFVADNGDEFYTSFNGSSTPGPNGTSIVVVHHTIIGGTGRFSDATGIFAGNTIANPALPTGTITYEGTISY